MRRTTAQRVRAQRVMAIGFVLLIGGWIGGSIAPVRAQDRLLQDPRWQPPLAPRSLSDVADRWVPGWTRVLGPYSVSVTVGATVREPIVLQGGVCYALIAWSDATADVDVHVYQRRTLVAQDVQPDAWPVARWCALRTGPLQVDLDVYGQDGEVQWGVWADAADLHAALGPFDEVTNRLERLVGQVAPRWTAVGNQRRLSYSSPAIQSVPVQPSAESCDLFVAVGTVGVHDVDLRLIDADGAAIDTDVAPDRGAVVQVCGQGEPLTLLVAVPAGLGTVGVQHLRRALNPR